LGDLKFVGRPLGLHLRQGQDKRVALLVFLHFYPAIEMLSQFHNAFQIGFLDDDFYGVFGIALPAIIADVGPEATKRFFEFFTVPIRNKNTKSALSAATAYRNRSRHRKLSKIQ
jgi:hypothetical protein